MSPSFGSGLGLAEWRGLFQGKQKPMKTNWGAGQGMWTGGGPKPAALVALLLNYVNSKKKLGRKGGKPGAVKVGGLPNLRVGENRGLA